TPSAQKPLLHCEAEEQACPLASKTLRQTPFWHKPLEQSLLRAQSLPIWQGAQVPPPQSTSVSSPFLTTSVQEGFWQTPLEQKPLRQSSSMRQALPTAHRSHKFPLQSMSVSLPSRTPSV